MKNETLRSTSSGSLNRMPSSLTTPQFAQRFTHAATARARYPLPPLGSLWDPHFLDRLHAPLTRYRD